MGGHGLSEQRRESSALRAINLLQAMHVLGVYWKEDVSFAPTHSSATRRYHVDTGGANFELLITNEKWFDVGAGKGGGGAIDLTMHLYSEPFTKAQKRLKKAVGPNAV